MAVSTRAPPDHPSVPQLDRARLRDLQQSRLLQRFDYQVGYVLKILESTPPPPANAAATARWYFETAPIDSPRARV